jgi:tRNA threonylcarbamoyl adenosine modification protein (Sua5/YciO/YrdC/YwlC family)
MAQFFSIHPTHPQKRLVRQAADIVRRGGLIAYPTDSCYALGCRLDAASALSRLRAIRGIDERHHLTLMCRELSEIAKYAMVSDKNFALLKVPGSYTFILPARREVPRRVTRKKTIGVRIPGQRVVYGGSAQGSLRPVDSTRHGHQ